MFKQDCQKSLSGNFTFNIPNPMWLARIVCVIEGGRTFQFSSFIYLRSDEVDFHKVCPEFKSHNLVFGFCFVFQSYYTEFKRTRVSLKEPAPLQGFETIWKSQERTKYEYLHFNQNSDSPRAHARHDQETGIPSESGQQSSKVSKAKGCSMGEQYISPVWL